ncbi:Uncharacterised protein [Bordetella pertussis]|nr:Uncharacterised protein [Bordetella pertussis]
MPFCLSRSRTGIPMATINDRSVAASGGVFRYSMMAGYSPLLRISPSTLRDVAQAGL